MNPSRRIFSMVAIVIGLALLSATLAYAEIGAIGVGGRPATTPSGLDEMNLMYRFNGLTDDGAKGAATRKEATSIHCTNFGITNSQVEVQLFQWSGAMVYTGTVSMAPDASFTFSTQNTTIYFDDLIFGSGGGTDAIFQGSGKIWASNRRVICSAQVLDPLNYPPTFALRLPLYDGNGQLVNRRMPDPDVNLPVIFR